MWPWLPERVVVVHIPCVLTSLLHSSYCSPAQASPAPFGGKVRQVSLPRTLFVALVAVAGRVVVYHTVRPSRFVSSLVPSFVPPADGP